MKISGAEEATLLVAISEAIKGGRLGHYGYVMFPDRWERNFKDELDNDFRDRLYKHLDEGGLESLLQRYFRQKIVDFEVELPPSPTSGNYTKSQKEIVRIKCFSDTISIARDIVLILKSLPFQYEVFALAFPSARDSFPSTLTLKFSDRLSLVSSDQVPEEFKTKSDQDYINNFCRVLDSTGDNYEKIDKGALYFRYRTSGLITDRVRPKVLQPMYDDIRAFYGAAMCFNLISYVSFFKTDVPYPVFVNRIVGDKYELTLVEKADQDLHDSGQSFATKDLRDASSNPKAIDDLMKPIEKMFSSHENQRLRTSAIWLLRSFLSEKGMDRILDATIAIEVLLGDRDASDRVGLSKLMANRCAYSLGSSAAERKSLYDFFINFYRVRSEIVHSGRLYISSSERDIVDKGLELAARILRHEIEMN